MLTDFPIIEVLPAFMGNLLNVDIATPKNKRQQIINRASTGNQQFSLLHWL